VPAVTVVADAPSFSEPEPGAPVEEEPAAPAAPRFVPPVAKDRVEPVYSPKTLKRTGSQSVVLKVLVSERGKVVRVMVERGEPGSPLVAAAIDAVLRSTYQPATENGAPVRAWTQESYVFTP